MAPLLHWGSIFLDPLGGLGRCWGPCLYGVHSARSVYRAQVVIGFWVYVRGIEYGTGAQAF